MSQLYFLVPEGEMCACGCVSPSMFLSAKNGKSINSNHVLEIVIFFRLANLYVELVSVLYFTTYVQGHTGAAIAYGSLLLRG